MQNKKNLLIKNLLIVTMDKNDILKGDLLIENGIIKKIGKVGDHKNTRVINGSNFIALPGLINAHFHFGETGFRAQLKRSSLEEYLRYTITFNDNHKYPEAFRLASADAAATESMLAGTTTFCASRNWDTAKKYGLRGIFCYPLMKTKKIAAFLKEIDKKLQKARKNESDLITIGAFIHSLRYVDKNTLNKLKLLMLNGQIPLLTVHVGETKKEVEETIKIHGKPPVKVLESYGLLTQKTLLVHCIHLTPSEKRLIVKRNAAVCLCPTSNLWLGEKLPDINFFLENNSRLCLGTDGLATGSSASLLSTARIAGLVFNHPKLDSTKLLSLITKDAAKCLSLKVGRIKEGFPADIALFSKETIPAFNNKTLTPNIIFSALTQEVEAIVIHGNFISKKSLLQTNGKNNQILNKVINKSFKG